MSELTGKVAIVTGASKGIGAAIAKGLGAVGASVAVNYASSREGADRVVAGIASKGGKATAAKEVGPKEIRVHAINSGGVETEGVHSMGLIGSEFEKQMVARTPLGRLGQPDDIASVAVFLASAESGWMTGETIAVGGGFS